MKLSIAKGWELFCFVFVFAAVEDTMGALESSRGLGLQAWQCQSGRLLSAIHKVGK